MKKILKKPKEILLELWGKISVYCEKYLSKRSFDYWFKINGDWREK